MTDITAPLPPPTELMDSIELQCEWEPRLSAGLRQTLKFDQFSLMFGHGRGTIGGEDTTHVSDLPGITGSSSTTSYTSGYNSRRDRWQMVLVQEVKVEVAVAAVIIVTLRTLDTMPSQTDTPTHN